MNGKQVDVTLFLPFKSSCIYIIYGFNQSVKPICWLTMYTE